MQKPLSLSWSYLSTSAHALDTAIGLVPLAPILVAMPAVHDQLWTSSLCTHLYAWLPLGIRVVTSQCGHPKSPGSHLNLLSSVPKWGCRTERSIHTQRTLLGPHLDTCTPSCSRIIRAVFTASPCRAAGDLGTLLGLKSNGFCKMPTPLMRDSRSFLQL